MTMASTIALITGANTGIGYQIVRALYNSNKAYEILVGGRSLEKAEAAIKAAKTEYPSSQSKLLPIQIDIESDESIHRAVAEVQSKYGRVDTLINNAGAQFDLHLTNGKLSERAMWNQTWNVNVSGTQVLTSNLIPLLLNSTDPRILFLTSGLSTLAGSANTSIPANRSPAKGWPKTGGFSATAYRSSKTGLNMMMREWHRVLKEDGVKVWSVAPGFLATGLGLGDPEALKGMGAGDPVVAGPFIRGIVEGQHDGDVGMVVTRNGVQEW